MPIKIEAPKLFGQKLSLRLVGKQCIAKTQYRFSTHKKYRNYSGKIALSKSQRKNSHLWVKVYIKEGGHKVVRYHIKNGKVQNKGTKTIGSCL